MPSGYNGSVLNCLIQQRSQVQTCSSPAISSANVLRGIASTLSAGRWMQEGKRQLWRGVVASSGNQTPLSAKELERDAAKEALLLAIADAGGVDALVSGNEDKVGRITVGEKLLVLERLNPTPRPTTSPLLEGLWEFKWAGARSPGVIAARTLLRRFPSVLATIKSINIIILDGTTKATASLKLFNTVETSVTLSTKLIAEGPTRLKEEYVEGVLASPSVLESNIPSQLKGAFGQLVAAVERLPNTVKEVLAGGVKVPLTGTYERLLLISYLDEEILVARDESGVPDVLYKLQPAIPVIEPEVTIIPEYVS
ncbi:unnamed protein product [Sphagnum jensenii]|uniref:Plastid lipid-associated protein/fibrillin conserved domain-containing protein n=1 Tax=Sphagnum jensenii TaxID=128206 RepID=A0ABP1BU89_9BRYO